MNKKTLGIICLVLSLVFTFAYVNTKNADIKMVFSFMIGFFMMFGTILSIRGSFE